MKILLTLRQDSAKHKIILFINYWYKHAILKMWIENLPNKLFLCKAGSCPINRSSRDWNNLEIPETPFSTKLCKLQHRKNLTNDKLQTCNILGLTVKRRVLYIELEILSSRLKYTGHALLYLICSIIKNSIKNNLKQANYKISTTLAFFDPYVCLPSFCISLYIVIPAIVFHYAYNKFITGWKTQLNIKWENFKPFHKQVI